MDCLSLDKENYLQKLLIDERIKIGNLLYDYDNLKASQEKEMSNCEYMTNYETDATSDIPKIDRERIINLDGIQKNVYICDICKGDKQILKDQLYSLRIIHEKQVQEYDHYITKLKEEFNQQINNLKQNDDKLHEFNEAQIKIKNLTLYNQQLEDKILNVTNDIKNMRIQENVLIEQKNNKIMTMERDIIDKDMQIQQLNENVSRSKTDILKLQQELETQLKLNRESNTFLQKTLLDNEKLKGDLLSLGKKLETKDNLIIDHLNTTSLKLDTQKERLSQQMVDLTMDKTNLDIEVLVQGFQTKFGALESEYEARLKSEKVALSEENLGLKDRLGRLAQELGDQQAKWSTQAERLRELISDSRKENEEHVYRIKDIFMAEKRKLMRILTDLRKGFVKERASKAKLYVKMKTSLAQSEEEHSNLLEGERSQNAKLLRSLEGAKNYLEDLKVDHATYIQKFNETLEETRSHYDRLKVESGARITGLEKALAGARADLYMKCQEHKLKKEKYYQLTAKLRAQIKTLKEGSPQCNGSTSMVKDQGIRHERSERLRGLLDTKLEEVTIGDKVFFTVPPLPPTQPTRHVHERDRELR